MMTFLRNYGIRILGAIVALMAVLSVLYTASYNRAQTKTVICGGQLVEQVISALKARDVAAVEFSAADRRLIEARYTLLLILSKAPEAPAIPLLDAVHTYERVVHDQETASDAYVRAIETAPLPDPHCLET